MSVYDRNCFTADDVGTVLIVRSPAIDAVRDLLNRSIGAPFPILRVSYAARYAGGSNQKSGEKKICFFH